MEDKISQLETVQKDINEKNAGLFASNELLKKQLAYFEDIFARQSLVGCDNGGGNINKNDLVEF